MSMELCRSCETGDSDLHIVRYQVDFPELSILFVQFTYLFKQMINCVPKSSRRYANEVKTSILKSSSSIH